MSPESIGHIGVSHSGIGKRWRSECACSLSKKVSSDSQFNLHFVHQRLCEISAVTPSTLANVPDPSWTQLCPVPRPCPEMEEDMEVGLVQQFSCLGTTDKDVLVAQLQRIVGPSLNPSAAHFFLDMNNWNLQLAVGAYFDLTEDVSPSEPAPVSGTTSTYSMSLVDERSAGEEPTVTPGTKFVRTWRIRNSGSESWPHGSFLRFKTGHRMGASERIQIHPAHLKAGEEAEVSVEFLSPCEVGAFDSRWQMSTPEGFLFGDEIWVIVTVGPDLTLDIASRLRTLTCQPPDS